MAGDISMVAPRRMLAQAMSRFEDHVYSYRWDVAALNTSTTIGVQHFAEVGDTLHVLYQIIQEGMLIDYSIDVIDPIRLRKSSPEYLGAWSSDRWLLACGLRS
jgi:hypothetical protein